ncbi:MAG: glutamate--cysteine ligase [Candidatus Nanohaloarchaea archaeon]|nr:glutamate--cysteine ligase [Candidatus Nanohaloarchaea archaeon]
MEHPFMTDGTLGVEEEFYAVDPNTLEPVSASDDLLQNPPGQLEGKIDVELFKCILELRTSVCDSMEELKNEIDRKRQYFTEYARTHGYDIIAAGLHPMARWRELEHVEKPRYIDQMERIQYPQHRNLTAGLHVHVGVEGAEKAVYIVNEARRHLPLLLALSANSPFWNGHSTGLRSSRANIFENLPNTGIPTRFDSWQSFRTFERTMLSTGSIHDRGELWWDIRPHTGYGTVEFRVMDTQISQDKTIAFARLIQQLVDHLGDRYDQRGGKTQQQHELLKANKWKAARHGQEALLLRDEEKHSIDTELSRLDRKLDLRHNTIETLQQPSGASKQLEAFDSDNLHDVCRSCII